MARPRRGNPHWEVLTVKLPPEMRLALNVYCTTHAVSVSDAIRRGLTQLFADNAVTSAAALAAASVHLAATQARLQESDAELAKQRARLAHVQQAMERLPALQGALCEQLIDALVPALTVAAQANNKQLRTRIMDEGIPAVMQSLRADVGPQGPSDL